VNAPVPMLATDHGLHDTQFPVLVQPKLDGFRCMARREAAGWVLYSRRGKVLRLPHITDAMRWLSVAVDTVLDGELYIHGRGFQHLTSAIRTASSEVEFHIFDIVSDKPAAERQDTLVDLELGGLRSPIQRVGCHVVALQQHLDRIYADTLAAGYEGIVLRDPGAGYEAKRSWALQKLKPWCDAEFLVIGWRPATNAPHLLVLTCRNDLGSASFDVTLPSIEHQTDECVGRVLTVRFCGRTDALIPRHATAVRFRDDHAIEPGVA
jgi:ATP-dependent DNA ligase